MISLRGNKALRRLSQVSGEKGTEQKKDSKMAAPRSIGSLTISFGLVAIPVKLYTATQSTAQISFNLLHKECGSRLRQQYVCQKDGQIVERDDMVKGYEFAKDQYVAFTPEEIKTLDEVGTPRSRSRSSCRSSPSIRCTSTRRITWRPTRVRRSPTRCSPRRSRNRSAARWDAGPARARRTS